MKTQEIIILVAIYVTIAAFWAWVMLSQAFNPKADDDTRSNAAWAALCTLIWPVYVAAALVYNAALGLRRLWRIARKESDVEFNKTRSMAWFVNEDGDVYEHEISTQRAAYPNDFHRPFATKAHAEEWVEQQRWA